VPVGGQFFRFFRGIKAVERTKLEPKKLLAKQWPGHRTQSYDKKILEKTSQGAAEDSG